MAKVTRTSQKKHADRLWSQIIRAYGQCELRGRDAISCGGPLQAAHIVGRANHRLRWDLENGLCACAAHHVYYTHHPLEWFELIETFYPSRWVYVKKHKNEIADHIDYEELIADLKERLAAEEGRYATGR